MTEQSELPLASFQELEDRIAELEANEINLNKALAERDARIGELNALQAAFQQELNLFRGIVAKWVNG